MMLRKVDAINLKIGMYVAELDRPWAESPFPFQGFFIDSDEDIARLRDTCQFVYVDDMKGPELANSRLRPRVLTPGKTATVCDRVNPAEKAAFSSDIQHVAQARGTANSNVTRVLNDTRMGKSVDTQESKAVVETLVDTISHNPNSMLWLTNLRQKHERTANHCLNVSILAIAFGRHLGLDAAELNVLGLGAMLHDVGKMRIPPLILDKPSSLTEEELKVVQKHPAEGYGVLKLSKQLSESVLDIVRHHHEHIDGSGYPDKLTGDQVSQMARIVGIVDAYDNLTGDSVYRTPLPPADALQVLHTESGEYYGSNLVQEFVRCLGIYPVGSLVELHSGAIAMVISSNPNSRLTPMVMMIRDEEGRNLKPRPLLDLSTLPDNMRAEKWGIKGMANALTLGLDLAAIVLEEAIG